MDRGHVHDIHGIELVAVQILVDGHKFRQVLDVDVGCGLSQNLFTLFVQLGSLGIVRRCLCLLVDLVVLLVGIIEHILVGVAGIALQHGSRGQGCGIKAHNGRLVVPVGVHIVEPGGPVDLLNLGGNAHCGQLLHEDFGGLYVRRVIGGNLDCEGKAIAIARLFQQRLGLFCVTAIEITERLVKVLGKGRIHSGTHLGAVSILGQLQNAVHIHRIAQGLTHPLVIEGLLAVVQIQRLNQIHRTFQDIVVVIEIGDVLHRQMGTYVDRAGVQCRHHGGCIFINLVGDLVQIGWRTVVVRILFQNHVLLDGAGLELEGTGTDGLGLIVCIILRSDVDISQVADELGGGTLQFDDDSGIIRRLNAVDIRKRLYQGGLHRGSGASIKGIENVVYGHGFPIVELHAVTQFKRVRQLIFRNRVVFCDSRVEIAVGVGLDQTFVNVK